MTETEVKKLVLQAVNKISPELKKINRDMGTFHKDATTKLAGVKQGFKEVALQIGAIAVAYQTAKRAASQAFSVMIDAAKFSQMEMAWQNMARSVGVSARRVVDELKQLSGDTISTFQAMQAASTAALLNVPIEQLSGIMKTARASATALAGDVGVAFDEIVRGIARGSAEILDNWGIKATGAVKKYAASLGKAESELTDVERQQALLNKVLLESARIMEQVGTAATETTDLERWQKLLAALRDLKDELGQGLLPMFRTITEAMTWAIGGAVAGVQTINFREKAFSDEPLSAADAPMLMDLYVKTLEEISNLEATLQKPIGGLIEGLLGSPIQGSLDMFVEQAEFLSNRIQEEFGPQRVDTVQREQAASAATAEADAAKAEAEADAARPQLEFDRWFLPLIKNLKPQPASLEELQATATYNLERARANLVQGEEFPGAYTEAETAGLQALVASFETELAELAAKEEAILEKMYAEDQKLVKQYAEGFEREEMYYNESIDAIHAQTQLAEEQKQILDDMREKEAEAAREQLFVDVQQAFQDTQGFMVGKINEFAQIAVSEETGIPGFFAQFSSMFASLTPEMLLVIAAAAALTEVFIGLWEIIEPSIEGIWTPLQEILRAAGNMIGTLLLPVLSPIEKLMSSLVGPVGNVLEGLFTALSPLFETLGVVLAPIVGVLQILNPILTLFGNLLAALSPLFEAVGFVVQILFIPMTGVMIAIVSLMNLFSQGMNDTFGWLPGWTPMELIDVEPMFAALPQFEEDDLPQFQEGGPVLDDTLAVLHSGEYVLPATASRSAGRGDVYVTVSAPNAQYLDPALAEELVRTGLRRIEGVPWR